MTRFIDAYFFASVHAARPVFFLRAFLAILAFDAWTALAAHGGRYGQGGFNVAHFPFLDRWQPIPSPSLYVGMVTVVGLLALGSAVGRLSRPVLAVIAALYTWAWAMSMIDSYQHHYLLSLVLALLVCFPLTGANRLSADLEDKRTTGWTWHLLAVTVALVYVWTAVSKFEPDWRDGTALVRIAGEPLRGLNERWSDDSSSFDSFIRVLSPTVGLLQVVIAVGYLAVPLAPRLGLARAAARIGGLAAVAFHVGAEWLDLQIGWFSAYMLLLAGSMFLPDALWDVAARKWAALTRACLKRLPTASGDDAAALRFCSALGAAAFVIVVGRYADLPGTNHAALCVAAVLVLFAVLPIVGIRRGAGWSFDASIAAALAAIGLWSAVTISDVRFDFYRFLGGAHWRVGEWDEALAAYQQANRYAPEGLDRRRAEREARRFVRRPTPP